MKYFCFALNIRILGGDSAWNRRFQKGHFRGPVIPFGAQVQFLLPKRVQMRQGKRQERAVDGVLLGYHQHPGGRWSGDFIVAELPQPSGGGDVPERPRIFRTADVHTVKGKPWSFPLSDKHLDDEAVLDWQIEETEDHDGDSDEGAPSRILMMVTIPTIRSKSRSVRVSRMRQASRLPQPRRMPRPTPPFVAVTPKGTSRSGSGTTRQRRRYEPRYRTVRPGPQSFDARPRTQRPTKSLPTKR